MKKTLPLSVAAMLILSGGALCHANDAQDFNEALKLTKAGKFLEATRLFRSVQARHPNDVNVLCQLGFSYERNFNGGAAALGSAQKCFERALQLDPECGEAYHGMALCVDSRGDYVKGIEYCTKALKVKKPDLEGYRERAGALSNLKRDKEALVDVETYIKKTNTKDPEVFLQKATILENLKRFDLALIEYRALLKAHYEDSLVYREVACLQALHKPEEAIKCISSLISKNKQDDASYLTRARLYESLGKHKESLADFSTAIDLQPSTTALKERASVYDKIGKKELADKDRRDADRI